MQFNHKKMKENYRQYGIIFVEFRLINYFKNRNWAIWALCEVFNYTW